MTMKKILLSFLALGGLLFASSCQMDEPDAGTLTGEVDFSITAGIPSGITTYSPADGNAFSHMGGANNVDATSYDLRFILEVYDGETLAYRDVQSVDENFTAATVNFNARLLAKSYTFVLWADFVNDGSVDNLYYNADNLKEISYTETVRNDVNTLSTDIADAYSANKVIDLSTSSKSESIKLTRPFGKIRLLATDAPQNIENQNSNIPVSATIAFTDAKVPTTFNARTGEASEPTLSVTEYIFTAVKESSPVVTGHSDLAQEGKFAYLLGQTYFFESPVSTAYKMTVTVNNATEQIGYRELTNIPVSANKLTTVIGNFYTNESNLEVIVEDKFGNDEEVISADKWDGTSSALPIINDDAKTVDVYSAAQLAGFVELVNSDNTYEGYTVTLHSSLDLNGKEWTPIATGTRSGSNPSGNSFKGTFDGNGNTIYNLSITTDPKNPDQAIGLFGIVDGGTVKNLKFENVDIDVPSSEMAAAAVGMLTGGGTVSGIEVVSGSIKAIRGNGAVVGRMTKSGTISTCTNHAAITGTGANIGGIVGAAYYTENGSTMTIEDCHNYGTVSGTAGAVGGIVGLSAANVINCTNEAAITGNGPDVAGIVAEQQNAGSITGCVNKGDITNKASAYGTGGIVGWIRYNGTTSAYPVKNVIEVSGNTNYGSVTGGNDAGGIVGTVYNFGNITANYNYAPTLRATTFAAGIVGNAQFPQGNEGPIGMSGFQEMVNVKDNSTATSLDKITVDGSCKDLFVYINNQSKVTEENNTLLINTADQFKSFATAVNNGNTFSGINVALGSDIDLSGVAWSPIGPSGDGKNKFMGTLDGCNHTISNLKVTQEAGYHAAGLFGALNGTVKNLIIDGATIENLSSGPSTVNGTAVVAGSIYTSGLIDNVTVKNATVQGNRYLGGISGYVYGSITNCSVETITLVATPDNLTGTYDNGDKVGGIVGYIVKDGSNGTVENCTVRNATIQGYRDIGGIAGCANSFEGQEVVINGCSVSDITLTQDFTNGYKTKAADVSTIGSIFGRGYIAESNVNNETDISILVKVYDSETAQLALDAASSARTIEFADGTYDQLFIRQSAPTTVILNPTGHPDYKRTISNLTIKAASDGATVNGFKISAGHVYTDSYNAVTDTEVSNGQNAYYSYFDISNLIFNGFKMTSSFYIGSDSNTDSTPFLILNGLTINSCSMTSTDNTSNNENNRFVRIGNGSKRIGGITVSNCSAVNVFQGIMTYGIVDITIDRCTFDNLGHNVFQTGGGKSSFQNCTIQNCSSDRLFRQTSETFPSEDWIKILNNIVTNSDGDATDTSFPYFKSGGDGTVNVNLEFSGNTMDGKEWTIINQPPQ